jgi:predicted RNA polymerase sigma factor
VLHVLYLIFSEGYAASGGRELQRTELSSEAIRLATMLPAARRVHKLSRVQNPSICRKIE